MYVSYQCRVCMYHSALCQVKGTTEIHFTSVTVRTADSPESAAGRRVALQKGMDVSIKFALAGMIRAASQAVCAVGIGVY